MICRILAPAARELREAAQFYESKVPGLGVEFVREVRAALRRIRDHPEAWFPIDPPFRRCRTLRFPYGIIYRVEAGSVVVVSVMHLHREPDSWRSNL